MKRARPAGRKPAARAAAGPWRALALWLVPAVFALGVHNLALAAFFTTDDLILFERVRGIAAWDWTPWRLVSGRLVWLLGFPLFGTQPGPWHALELALHALNAALLTRWATRLGVRPAAAMFAGALFAVSAGAMTTLWSVTGIGELLACTFTLAGLLALAAAPPRTVPAWAAFGFAILSKENVVLAPLAALAGRPRAGRGALLRVAAPALAAGALLWGYILVAGRSLGSLQGEAYAFGFGPHLLGNLRDYAGWALDRFALAPVSSPPAAAFGLLGLAVLALLAVSAWRGVAAAAAGLALFVLALLPVLPLTHHTYIHYLYVPLAGWCVAAAGALDAQALSKARGRIAAVAFAAIAAWAAYRSASAMTTLVTDVVPELGIPRDSFLRRMTVAYNASHSLERQLPAGARELVILRPAESRRGFDVRTGLPVPAAVTGQPAYDLLPASLDEGRGLRALLPQLRDVRFGEVLAPGDTAATLATSTSNGRMAVTGTGPAGVAGIVDIWAHNRMDVSAIALLRSALALWPRADELHARLGALEKRSAGTPAAP